MSKVLKQLVTELEIAEDDAGYSGHTDARHQRILDATAAIQRYLQIVENVAEKRHQDFSK